MKLIPTIYNVPLTEANKEYSLQLPKFVHHYTLQVRGTEEARMQFISGKVATGASPYWTIKSRATPFETSITTDDILYFASGSAGAVIEMIAWHNDLDFNQ